MQRHFQKGSGGGGRLGGNEQFEINKKREFKKELRKRRRFARRKWAVFDSLLENARSLSLRLSLAHTVCFGFPPHNVCAVRMYASRHSAPLTVQQKYDDDIILVM
jgi:hypothetical protein